MLKRGDEQEHQALPSNYNKGVLLWYCYMRDVFLEKENIPRDAGPVLHFWSSRAADGAYCPGLSLLT